jgi:tRNA(fMet)-specific endonuclease VapC
MGIVLDSSILIATERHRFELRGFSAEHGADDFVIAAITAAEPLHGWERCSEHGTKHRRGRFIEDHFSKIPIAPYNLQEARRHAHIWAYLEARGERIGAHDLIVAATALSLQYSLATRNASEFSRVPGLQPIPVSAFVKA